jgi:nucleotide-binding universal stress UspA family protein
VARGGLTPKVDVILVGVDGSQDAHHALEWSMFLAEHLDAQIVAVHAVGLLTHLDEGPPIPSQSHLVELQRAFEEQWCSVLSASGRPHRMLMRNGPPVAVLIEAALAEHADLMVVGRRGIGAGPGLLGSTSHQLAERSHRPVVIVPPTGSIAPADDAVTSAAGAAPR